MVPAFLATVAVSFPACGRRNTFFHIIDGDSGEMRSDRVAGSGCSSGFQVRDYYSLSLGLKGATFISQVTLQAALRALDPERFEI